MQMNVGQLKELLNDLPDDVMIVEPSFDHSYVKANCRVITAIKESPNCWSEYFELPDIEMHGERQQVLVIGNE